MPQSSSPVFLLFVALFVSTGAGHTALSDDEKGISLRAKQSSDKKADRKKDITSSKPPKKQLFTGQVVNLQDALKRRGVSSAIEFKKQVVLETSAGTLIPIVPDWRGRAFFQDTRLQNRKVDLVGYLKKGTPYLQVLMVFTYNKKGERQYTDYWCDICSIPMYEIKPCDCCQAPIRLRYQHKELPSYLSPVIPSKAKKPIESKKSK
jgi:hypothetical protein